MHVVASPRLLGYLLLCASSTLTFAAPTPPVPVPATTTTTPTTATPLRENKPLTAEQIADIEEKIEIIKQTRQVINSQSNEFKTSIANYKTDKSEGRVDALIAVAASQQTRIDVLNETI